MGCIGIGILIILGISAICAYVQVYVWLNAWQYLIFYVILALLTIIAIKFSEKIRCVRYNKPPKSSKQKKQLKEAELLDNKNREENEHNKQVAQQQWDENRESRNADIDRQIAELTSEFNDLSGKAIEHLQAIDAIDILCEDDKNLPIIDALINIIETHRADSVKEALQVYDTMQANDKLLALEQKKLELQKEQMRQEKLDRELRLQAELDHQRSVESQMRNIADSKEKAAKKLDFISWQLHTMGK